MVRAGAVLRARDITLAALNDQEQSPVVAHPQRHAHCARLRDLGQRAGHAGNKAIYVRITSPDGYVLTTEAMPTFEFEGER